MISPLEALEFHSIQHHMAQLLNLSPQSSRHLISSAEVSLEPFLDIVIVVDHKEAYWPRMMTFYLYAQFLLISPFGNCDSKVLHVLDQVEANFNPFPPILTETIIVLDNF